MKPKQIGSSLFSVDNKGGNASRWLESGWRAIPQRRRRVTVRPHAGWALIPGVLCKV